MSIAPFSVRSAAVNGLLAFAWYMFDAGGNEVGGCENLVILFGVPAAFGSINDLLGFLNFHQGQVP